MAFYDRFEQQRGGENSGSDSEDFTVEQHLVPGVEGVTDATPQAAANHAAVQNDVTNTAARSAAARRGMALAMQNGDIVHDGSFAPSIGCYVSGSEAGEYFRDALRYSGGVRQGPEYTSDPAPGVARVEVDHWVTLDDMHKQSEGLGRTFESQRRANWVRD